MGAPFAPPRPCWRKTGDWRKKLKRLNSWDFKEWDSEWSTLRRLHCHLISAASASNRLKRAKSRLYEICSTAAQRISCTCACSKSHTLMHISCLSCPIETFSPVRRWESFYRTRWKSPSGKQGSFQTVCILTPSTCTIDPTIQNDFFFAAKCQQDSLIGRKRNQMVYNTTWLSSIKMERSKYSPM